MSGPDELARWIGRREVRTDALRARDLAAWNAMLDRDDLFPGDGDPAPPGFHWTLFPPIARQSELGRDGHPRRGGFLPPVNLPRRMWAGSRIRFGAPLRVGQRVEQSSVVERIEEKSFHRKYATAYEGYPGLVVHGPLLATLLLEAEAFLR